MPEAGTLRAWRMATASADGVLRVVRGVRPDPPGEPDGEVCYDVVIRVRIETGAKTCVPFGGSGPRLPVRSSIPQKARTFGPRSPPEPHLTSFVRPANDTLPR